MFTTVCPGCEASLNAPDTVKGKKVKCKKCGEPFVAKPAKASDDDPAERKTVKMKSPPPPVKSRRDEADEDDMTDEAPSLKGKKSKKRDQDEDTEVMESMRDEDDEEEDEPKPKKKKGGGKKKSKKKESSPMLLILIAVSAIVLIGGGIGAYFMFFNDESKPTTPSTKGGTSTENTKQGGATAVAAGWVDVHDPEGRFRIKFPSQPQVLNRKEQSPLGEINVKMHVMGSQTELFVCGHVPMPADRPGITDEQLLDAFLEVSKAKEKGEQISEPKTIQFQGFTGREFTAPMPGKKGMVVARAILAKDRVIVLGSGAENATADSPRVKAFFESLKIE